VPPTNTTGSAFCLARCSAMISASYSSLAAFCSSSRISAKPSPDSSAACPTAATRSRRSSARIPESATPGAASTSIFNEARPPNVSSKDFSARRALRTLLPARFLASMLSSAVRATRITSAISEVVRPTSLVSAYQPASVHMTSNSLSSTVLPTPRRPVISTCRSAREAGLCAVPEGARLGLVATPHRR
jgi:hypothetical protein